MSAHKYDLRLFDPSFDPWAPAGPESRQIAVLLSGGVDSSTAAALLKENGWEVLGITMKIPVSGDDAGRSCCGADAAIVCGELGIPHYFVDAGEAFDRLIIEPFRESYSRGETPNPCADCNTLLKFSLLWDFLTETFGIARLATGHYARVLETAGGTRLARAADRAKDQSYFLYGIAAERLGRLVLPLGGMTKDKVRARAADLRLSVAEKNESMELCFAAEADYRTALPVAAETACGDIVDTRGNKLGTHKGIARYTLGQRQGLGYAAGVPMYVTAIDAESKTVTLGSRRDACSATVTADGVNVLAPGGFAAGGRLFGKIRSYGEPAPCRLKEAAKDRMTVEFDRPQFAPCPGQKLVLYDADDCIVAGGTIIAPE
jgi:tRNA-specific 2-thiouridylase